MVKSSTSWTFKAKKQITKKAISNTEERAPWLISLLLLWIFSIGLDRSKQSFVRLYGYREVLAWGGTVHRHVKFSFDPLCAACVSGVWPFNGDQRENPLYRGVWAWHNEDERDNPGHADQVGFPDVLINRHIVDKAQVDLSSSGFFFNLKHPPQCHRTVWSKSWPDLQQGFTIFSFLAYDVSMLIFPNE